MQFDETQAIEHVWSMVRTRAQIERVVAGIEANPGVVLFTMVNEALRQILQEGCRRLQSPAIPVLDPVIGALGPISGARAVDCRASNTCSTASISRASTR